LIHLAEGCALIAGAAGDLIIGNIAPAKVTPGILPSGWSSGSTTRKFTAATPLGTSAGTDEAIHLVDAVEAGPHRGST
jgi:hypothetical protein